MASQIFPLRWALMFIALVGLVSPALCQCLDWRTFPTVVPAVNGSVYAQIVFDDGSGSALYAGGDLKVSASNPAARIQRWKAGGFEAVGEGIEGEVLCFAVFDAGAGAVLYAGTTNGLWRWDGQLWQRLAATAFTTVACLAVWDDGSGPALYVAGSFATIGGISAGNVARWDGSVWQPLSTGLLFGSSTSSVRVGSLIVHDDGSGSQLYAAGYFTTAGGVSAAGLARWNGSTWAAVGGCAVGYTGAFKIALHDDGNGVQLYISSVAVFVGTQNLGSLARWNGNAWSAVAGAANEGFYHIESIDLGTGPLLYGARSGYGGNTLRAWNGSVWTDIGGDFTPYACSSSTPRPLFSLQVFDDGQGPRLYFGGAFNLIGGVASWFVRLVGNTWAHVGPTQEGLRSGQGEPFVESLLSHDDGSGPALYAAGSFCVADGAQAGRIARWRGTGWQSMGTPINGFPTAMIEHNAGNGLDLFVTASSSVQRWDGLSWTTVGSGTPSHDNYDRLATFGGELYVGGSFTFIQGVPSNNVARWDGSTWRPLATGVLGRVYAFAVHDDGSGPALYVGGTFSSASGVAAPYLARWNGTSWSALPSSVNGHVLALCSFDDGTGPALYAGGAFTTAGGMPASRIARWNGTSWTALGGGFDASVLALAAFDDGSSPRLFAVGDFQTSAGVATNHIARWDGAGWNALGNGVGPSPQTLAVHDDGTGSGPELFVAGYITTAGALPTSAVAAWRGCTTPISTTCFGDGSSTTCPCRQGSLEGHGCDNSWTTGGARFDASGMVGPDTIVMSCAGLGPMSAALVFQGDALNTAPQPFGDGLRCVSGNTLRLYTLNATAGTITVPPAGSPSISSRSAALGDLLATGSIRAYQVWYRDSNPNYCAAPLGAGWNLANAVRIVW